MYVISIYRIKTEGKKFEIRDWASAGMEAAELDQNENRIESFDEINWGIFCKNHNLDEDCLGGDNPDEILILGDNYEEFFRLTAKNRRYQKPFDGESEDGEKFVYHLTIDFLGDNIQMTVETTDDSPRPTTANCIFNETYTDFAKFEEEFSNAYDNLKNGVF